MAAIFTNDTFDLRIANNLTGHSTVGTAPLGSGSIGLVNSDTLGLDRQTTIAELEANEGGYAGYARQPITWNAASLTDDGTVEMVGTAPEFRPTGSSTVNMFGLFVTGLDSATLVGCGPLDGAPAPMGDAFAALVVTVRFRPSTGGISVDVS